MLVLSGDASGHWQLVLHEGRDDSLQKRLCQTSKLGALIIRAMEKLHHAGNWACCERDPKSIGMIGKE
ncbi:hypothetical protein CEXT_12981 [Caerostris extrusa]|uniref:Uncharacterized protein n=1 Tax=Caerostris extrusa TaxID=172846 RepID=A0AAV4VAV4_CAEEX|nr:hypothetical protein CEXT_12981 [Caerostris extrusa]